MTNQIPPEKTIDLTIDSFAAVQGRDGPQWKLTCSVPWSKPEYKSSFYIDREEGAAPPEPGLYRCLLRRSAAPYTNRNTGVQGDGSVEWHYNWYMNEFALDPETHAVRDSPSPTPAQAHDENAKRQAVTPHPLPPGTPPPLDVTRNSIERQVVFKAAVDIVVAAIDQSPNAPMDEHAMNINAISNMLWPVLQGIGNPSPDAVAGPESDEPPLYGTGMLPTPPPETQDAPDDGLSEAVREFRELATKHGWTGTMVKKWTGMSSQEYVNREPAPTNQFEIDGRWRDLTANCMDAWSKTVQPPAEDDQEKEPLPW